MAEDCNGLGPHTVSRKTVYTDEREVIPALQHGIKSRLLSHLRDRAIDSSDVLRVQVHQNSLDACTIICRLGDLENQPNSASLQVSTDKHRVLWMTQQTQIEAAGDIEATYRNGRLYIIKAAPKTDFSTRITFQPRAPDSGEYLAVVPRLARYTCTSPTSPHWDASLAELSSSPIPLL